jgi:hypothetical protein
LATLTLTTAAAPTFSDNLDLGDQIQTYTAALTAKDTSLAASPGWHLTITSTQFTTGTHTLSTSASSITAVTSACAGTCTVNPTNSVAYPLTIPSGAGPPLAIKFFNAAANTGQGTFTITPTVHVSVPQNSFAGTYTSTLTLAIVSGP